MVWHRCLKPAAWLVALSWVSAAAPAELYRYQNELGVTVVDWTIPAAYVSDGYEVLSESGQVVRVVPPVKTETDFERDAAAARVQEAEAAAQAEAQRRAALAAALRSASMSFSVRYGNRTGTGRRHEDRQQTSRQ